MWGGTYADRDDDLPNVLALIDNPVRFTTPAGVPTDVTPIGGKHLGDLDDDGTCDDDCFYVRTADVTALVQNGGAGTYTVGRVRRFGTIRNRERAPPAADLGTQLGRASPQRRGRPLPYSRRIRARMSCPEKRPSKS